MCSDAQKLNRVQQTNRWIKEPQRHHVVVSGNQPSAPLGVFNPLEQLGCPPTQIGSNLQTCQHPLSSDDIITLITALI